LEQSRIELTERLLCCQAQVDSHRLRMGRLRPAERERVLIAGELLSRTRLFIDDTPGQNMTRIAASVRRMKRLHGIGLAIVDYLQLVLTDGKKETRQEQVATISRRFKLLARELKIPIIVLAQLNRQVETRHDQRPKLSDLRESGALEQDADTVLMLHRQDDGLVDCVVAKQRNGPTGTAPLLYVKQHMRFEDYAIGRRPA
jgi:replicative DNA helicase